MMAGTYACFYWSDWLSDPELRACSALSRSLWMDMLCLAGVNDKRGYVMIGTNPATPAQLARIFGEPVEVVEGCLSELESNAVFSRDREGRIYSRRIIRDMNRTAASAKGGKIGGPVSRSKKTGIFSTRGPTPDSNTKYQIPKTIPPTPKGVEGGKESKGRYTKLSKLLGYDPNDWNRWLRFTRQVDRFVESGIDIDNDLIPCVEQMVAEGNLPADLDSLRYFDKPVRAFINARALAAEVNAELDQERRDKIARMGQGEWSVALERWLLLGRWHSNHGPRPDEDGCLAPENILTVARSHFETCGRKPYAREEGLYTVPIDWPAKVEWPMRNLDIGDLYRFVKTGEDFRVPPSEVDNVVPIRKAL